MRCPKGSMKISRAFSLKLLDWHGGQGSALYAAGSTGFAGRCVPKTVLRSAARELELVGMTPGIGPKVSVGRLVTALRRQAK